MRDVVACVVASAGRILLGQRAPHLPFPGRWCIPGGKVEADEELTDALRREMQEECGLRVDGLVRLGSVTLPVLGVTVTYYGAIHVVGDPTPSNELLAFQWVPVASLPDEPEGMPADCTPMARALITNWVNWVRCIGEDEK